MVCVETSSSEQIVQRFSILGCASNLPQPQCKFFGVANETHHQAVLMISILMTTCPMRLHQYVAKFACVVDVSTYARFLFVCRVRQTWRLFQFLISNTHFNF